MNAQVSVIIPAYNRADLIVQSLASVAAQSFPVSEVVVVDDGSTDETARVVSEWFGKHKSVKGRLLTLPTNVGKPTAVNIALGEITGQFVTILDSDDLLLPDAAASQVAFLRVHADCGMVFGLAYEMHGDNRTQQVTGGFGLKEEIADIAKHVGDLVLRVNPIVSSSAMIRRSVCTTVGGMLPQLRYTHDWEYWIRIARRFPVGFVPEPLVYYRMGTVNSSSANRLGTFREVSVLLSTESGNVAGSILRRSLLRHLRFNAGLSINDGKFFQTLGILWQALITAIKLVRP